MFLVEGERGCHRTCTFCVMRRSTNGGMRLVTPDRILSFVPEEAPRVGLVGAAISDHPELVGLLGRIVDSGRGVGISSLRADRVARKPDIARLLRAGGYKTLTVASDAAAARARLTSLTFDLIVLDLMLPGESGLDFATALRRESNVPILMLTAMNETDAEEDDEDGLAAARYHPSATTRCSAAPLLLDK